MAWGPRPPPAVPPGLEQEPSDESVQPPAGAPPISGPEEPQGTPAKLPHRWNPERSWLAVLILLLVALGIFFAYVEYLRHI